MGVIEKQERIDEFLCKVVELIFEWSVEVKFDRVIHERSGW